MLEHWEKVGIKYAKFSLIKLYFGQQFVILPVN